MIRGSGAAILALALIACARPADPDVARRGAPPPRADGRLPRRAHPTRYALDLVVDPAQARFSGRARINMRIDDPTSAVVMNARGFAGGRELTVRATGADGKVNEVRTIVRIDTPQEIAYYQHGGILHYVLRQLAST